MHTPFWNSWSLGFQWFKGQISAMGSWSVDFCRLEVTLIPWSTLKKGFDPMIQFWSQSQMFSMGHKVTTSWFYLEFGNLSRKSFSNFTFTYINRDICEFKAHVQFKFVHCSIQFPASVVPFQESHLTLIPQYQESSQYRHETGRCSRWTQRWSWRRM